MNSEKVPVLVSRDLPDDQATLRLFDAACGNSGRQAPGQYADRNDR
jgi:hypothetical protein